MCSDSSFPTSDSHPGPLPGSVIGPAGPPSHDARALTAGGTVATIWLDDQVYTLRITRSDKLILTK